MSGHNLRMGGYLNWGWGGEKLGIITRLPDTYDPTELNLIHYLFVIISRDGLDIFIIPTLNHYLKRDDEKL